jgi:hypothetical protein
MGKGGLQVYTLTCEFSLFFPYLFTNYFFLDSTTSLATNDDDDDDVSVTTTTRPTMTTTTIGQQWQRLDTRHVSNLRCQCPFFSIFISTNDYLQLPTTTTNVNKNLKDSERAGKGGGQGSRCISSPASGMFSSSNFSILLMLIYSYVYRTYDHLHHYLTM